MPGATMVQQPNVADAGGCVADWADALGPPAPVDDAVMRRFPKKRFLSYLSDRGAAVQLKNFGNQKIAGSGSIWRPRGLFALKLWLEATPFAPAEGLDDALGARWY
jgi:hypothetical protein